MEQGGPGPHRAQGLQGGEAQACGPPPSEQPPSGHPAYGAGFVLLPKGLQRKKGTRPHTPPPLPHCLLALVSPPRQEETWLDEFPVAAVANNPKPCGLKQHQCILLQFWRSEVLKSGYWWNSLPPGSSRKKGTSSLAGLGSPALHSRLPVCLSPDPL